MPCRTLLQCSYLALVCLVACATEHSTPGDDWIAAIVAAEPMFGGGAALEQRLFGDPCYGPAGDQLQREQFLRDQRLVHDQQAALLVRELVPEATARQVLPFLRSDAGNGLAAATTMALGLFCWQGDDFPRQAAQCYGDPAKVGTVAVNARLEAVRRAVSAGSSPSPEAVAMLIGGAKVAPAEADAIAAFFAGEAGKRWCELQCTAFPRTHERFLTFREEATGKHFLRWLGEPNDLVLPAAKYQEPGTGGR